MLAATLLLWPGHGDGFQPPTVGRQLVGFSYSGRVAASNGVDPLLGLGQLVSGVHPDIVRLPVYWDAVEPREGDFDFKELDAQLDLIAAHNRAGRHHPATRVVLVVGVRNLGSPEVFIPDWYAEQHLPQSLGDVAASDAHRGYLAEVVARYAHHRLLYAWQIQNEPLDDVTAGYAGHVGLGTQLLDDEIGVLRGIDQVHQVVVTTYNSAGLNLDAVGASILRPLVWHLPLPRPSGHPGDALAHADVLGLDVYVVTPATPLLENNASQRIAWKQETLVFWSIKAAGQGKELWITEMQAEPWNDLPGFGTDELIESARAYRGQGPRVTLLWGVETWLIAPDWMQAGVTATKILRGRQ